MAHSGGDLLDLGEVHPDDEHAAAFLATLLGDLIRDAGCPADVHVDGAITVEDLLLVLAGWNQPGAGDIDGNGLTDVLDLLLIIEAWGDCWPVQAPFAE